ncbi:MAG TPA: TonB-dependent receptor plug domain-containing protein [Opitutaceae bacterium]|nr:TonB-dependent receptor plug domain-containing protein [Opitutaceae bacterium]
MPKSPLLVRLAALVLLAAAVTPTLSAQVAPAATPSAADLAKYDRNHDGVLDAGELATMAADARTEAAAASSTAATDSAEGNVVQMSPFQVEAGNERGYLATNTLSGTRLNTKLSDLGASITVVTKQQMLDVAAIDINDIFLYEANTEGTGNYTSFTIDSGGNVVDNIQSGPQTANRIRGLDTANIARNNFAGNSSIPIDLYNTEAVEISRGPNSNIFGLGNTAGTVNIVGTHANLTRDLSTFTLRGDSYGGYRASVDLNRQVKSGVLAFRVSSVYQSTGYVRKPSRDETKREQGAVTYHPFSKTTLRASYESYHNYARRPNAVTPRDEISYWNSVGRPVWDPTTQTVTFSDGRTSSGTTRNTDGNLPLGVVGPGSGFYNRPSLYVDQGDIRFWTVNETGTLPSNKIPTPDNPNTAIRYIFSGTDFDRLRGTNFPLFVSPSITNKALYDWTDLNFVAPNYNKDKADTYNVELEQILLQTQHQQLAARAAWFREDFDSYSRNFISGGTAALYVDINTKLLDGSPNPYFMRPYLGASEPTAFRSPSVNDIQSADLAYQLTPAKLPKLLSWIGAQKLAAHGETRRIDTSALRYRNFILDDHTWLNSTNRSGATATRGYYKYYVGDNQGLNMDYAPPPVYDLAGRYNLNWLNAATNQWVQEPAVIGEGGITPSNRTRREIRTISLATQNYFLDDRVVTTFGWRRDKNRSRDSNGATVDPTTGLLNYDALKIWGPWLEKSGDTKTAGVVVKPLHWLYLHYNRSDSFQPATTQYNLFGEVLPNPTGKGRDYGFTLSLLDGKLNLKLNHYDTSQKNSRNGTAATVASRVIRLDTSRGGGDPFTFENWATNLANQRFAAKGIVPTAAQTSAAVAQIMQLPEGFLDSLVGKSISETSDIDAKGLELEANYTLRNWTVKVTAAQQISLDANISPSVQKYIDQRMPVWTTVKDDAGVNWWTYNNGGTPLAFYTGNVAAPLKLAIANQGKPRTQVREWRFNALTKYQFTEGRLKGFDIGGAVRWEDKASIGFLGAAPDLDGIVRSLDITKPVYDKARYYVDGSAGYTTRLFHDKIRTHFQFNVRNMFERGRLQAIAVNPDGTPYAFRIIDPRQFIFSTTFDL